jgi:ribosomal protein S18 acetylase RimI-like enzyme
VALLQGLALDTVTGVVIRSASGEGDVAFLGRMLCWAADWETAQLDESVLERPEVARYVKGWGRPGDAAVVAEKASGELVGAAWFRLFEATEPGYGFVDDRTPELGIGVEPGHRGEGIGRALLEALVASAREAGYSALSLSVGEENPALRIYERAGFERHAHGEGVWTLVLPLA